MPNLKAIMAKKKRLQKAHPSWDNAKALKEAWKGHKVSGMGTRKRKASPRKKRASVLPALAGIRQKSHSRKSVRGSSMGDIKITAREQLKLLHTVLGELVTRKMLSKKVTEKRQLEKKIQDVKKRINHINKILHS